MINERKIVERDFFSSKEGQNTSELERRDDALMFMLARMRIYYAKSCIVITFSIIVERERTMWFC